MNTITTVRDGARTQILAITLLTLYGLGITTVMANLTLAWKPTGITVLALAVASILLTLVCAIEDTVISICGYTALAAVFGALFGPVVGQYTFVSVFNILIGTLALTCVIGLAGIIYPKSVSSWGGFLGIGLLVLLGFLFGNLFLSALGVQTELLTKALDWVGIGLFGAFIFYDMNQAMFDEYTFANAVKYSIQMYLNILNIFIRLLSLFGDKDSD